MKNTNKQVKDIAEELSDKLVQMNLDLYQAETEEDFEKCSLITTGIRLFITNAAQYLSIKTKGNTKEIFDGLIAESEFIFQSIKENENKINNL